MKKITYLYLIIGILCTRLSATAYDFEVDGIGYKIISLSDLTCEVETMVSTIENVKIPSTITYNNRPITVISIRNVAFKNNKIIKSIEIPNSVTSIVEGSFSCCSSLTSIEIPNSVTSIGADAFSGCSSLTSIEIPNSVTSIGVDAFSGCSSLTSIEIPNSVTSIGSGAFENCKSLTSIEIPNSVTSIGGRVFYNCSSLASIEIPNSVPSIGGYAFYDCSSLASIEIPNSVTSIGGYAFSYCSSLTSIEIPNSVTSIGERAFIGCSSLASIEIPNSVTSIGKSAFYNCSSLASIVLSQNLKFIDYSTFNGCSNLSLFSIPGSIEEICFYYYSDSLYHKYDYTFGSCDKLKTLYFEYAKEYIKASWYGYLKGYGTHYYNLDYGWNNTSVKEHLLNQISTLFIDRNFNNDLVFSSLENLTIGSHLLKVDIDLQSSSNLTNITCYTQTPPTISNCTNKQYMDIIVKVPNESLDAYKNAEGWKNFWNIEGFDPSGIEDVSIDANSYKRIETGRYNLNGQPVSEDYKGVVIVRFSDGTTKKIMQ